MLLIIDSVVPSNRTPPIHAFLNDYVFLIRGLLDLYETTFHPQWIEWSEQLQDVQDSLFWDAGSKSYNLASAVNHTSILTLKDGKFGTRIMNRAKGKRVNLDAARVHSCLQTKMEPNLLGIR